MSCSELIGAAQSCSELLPGPQVGEEVRSRSVPDGRDSHLAPFDPLTPTPDPFQTSCSLPDCSINYCQLRAAQSRSKVGGVSEMGVTIV